jgi:hypothetical protein
VSSRSPATLEQNAGSTSKNAVLAIVTGIDSTGQLFRDSARIIFLKGQKCIYQSKVKPSPDNAVLIEMRDGAEPWRSDAKVRSVSPAGREQDGFRVTVELERAHSAVIECADEEAPPHVKDAAAERTLPPNANEAPAATKSQPKKPVPPAAEEIASHDVVRATVEAAPPPPPARKNNAVPAFTTPVADDVKPPPTSAARAAVADVVRSILASEVEQWKRDLQSSVADQVQAALRQPLQAMEAKIEQQRSKRPSITEESVQKIAAQAAENAQIEWATTSQKIVAEAVRAAVASDGDRQRQELRALISGEIEAAWKGPLAARLDDTAKKAVEAGFEEQARKRSALTEDSVRQLAAQVAEGIQLEWASTKLQKIIAEAVRSQMDSAAVQQRAEADAQISAKLEAAVQGPLAARMDAVLGKKLSASIEQYFQTPAVTGALQKLIAEAVRSKVESAAAQQRAEVDAQISARLEAAVQGPLAVRMDATLDKKLSASIEQYFQTPAAAGPLQKLVAAAVRQPLEAEYEQRARQIQSFVSREIEAAVHGPIASKMDEMLRGALDAQREEYVRNPPPLTDDSIRQITAGIAQHPQLQGAIDTLAAQLSERWAEIARTATANAQQDIVSRIATTERLTSQVVSDIQHRLDSFSTEMNRLLGNQDASASKGGSQPPAEPEQDRRFRELMQSTGSHFEREMKTVLQKIFGKS